MEKIEMVDLRNQHLKIEHELKNAINRVMNSGQFINGPDVKIFEKSLEAYLNISNAITCGNGTDALQVALMALDLKEGDEIITTPFTFVATAEAIAILKLKPVFVDVCKNCFNIDVSSIEKAITPRTKAIIPVHLYGQCANMEEIMELATHHKLWVIEDAAQALGSEYTFNNGLVKKAGTIGHIGCTSFFPSKNLGCMGDGGAIFTNISELAEKIRAITLHGSKVKYYHDFIGLNSRLDTIQAAILEVKLNYLDQYNSARSDSADFYDISFENIAGLKIPKRTKKSKHIFHAYTLVTDSSLRDSVRDFLAAKGVPTMVYYPVPMHLQKGYARFGYKKGDFPITEELCDSVFSIPVHTELTENQRDYIAGAVKEFYLNQ